MILYNELILLKIRVSGEYKAWALVFFFIFQSNVIGTFNLHIMGIKYYGVNWWG